MPQRTHKTGSLFGGVSRQPPHLRRENQVEEATNVALTVARGATSRPGTRYDRALTIPSYPSTGLRLHAVERDSSERYIFVYGDGVLRSFRDGGVESLVYQHSLPRLYMAGSGADDWRLVTIADTTLIASAAVTVTGKTSPSYSVAGDAPSSESLFSRTVGVGEYWRATQDDTVAASSHWRYKPGNDTFAVLTLPDANAAWSDPTYTVGGGSYLNPARQPMGGKVFFGVFPCATSKVGGAWTAATRTLTMPAGTFTGYTRAEGHYANITVGGTPGWYEVESAVFGGASVVLKDTTFSAIDVANATIDGIGYVGSMKIDCTTEDLSDMYRIALAFQRSLQDSLGQQALVAWVPKTGGAGHFEITSPWAGQYAHFPASYPTRSPASTVYDLTNAAGLPFYNTGSSTTAGTGVLGTATKSASSRWEHVPPPNQATALIDNTTAPQSLQRVYKTGSALTWATMTEKMLPYALYRFAAGTGTFAAYDTAGTNNGALVIGSQQQAAGTGPSAIASSYSITCTSAATGTYADMGVMEGIGNFLTRGFTVEFAVKVAAAYSSVFAVVGMGFPGTTAVQLHIRGNTVNGTAGSTNGWWVSLGDDAANMLTMRTGADTAFNDGNWHHVAVVVNTAAKTIVVYVDGVAQTMTTIANTTQTTFSDNVAKYPLTLGASKATSTTAASQKLDGSLAEVAFHPAVWGTDFVAARYGLYNSASYLNANSTSSTFPSLFVFSAIDWTPRFSGEPLTNKLPGVFAGTYKVSAMAYFDNRLWLGGGPNIAGSAVDDLFNFYAEDADNRVDSDPIDAPLSDDKGAANITDLVAFRRAMLVLTDGPRQYELSSEGNLTPSTVTLSATTAYRPLNVRPAAMDQAIYSCASGNQGANLMEYFPDESVSVLSVFNVSAHADGYLPATVRRIQAHSQTGRVFVLDAAKTTVYPYTTYWEGNKKIQSAWAKWTFQTDLQLEDIAVLGDELWTLQKLGSVWTLERMGCGEESTRNGLAESTHLDRQYVATGTYGGANTTWTFPVSDTTINRAVLLAGAGTVGTQVTVTSSGTTVTAAGADYSGGTVILGRAFTQEVELSEPFFKDPTGAASLNERKSYREVIVEHTDTGGYALVASTAGCTDRTETFAATVNSPQAVGELRAFPGGSTRDTTLTIRNTTARRFTVSAVETVLDVDGRVPQ